MPPRSIWGSRGNVSAGRSRPGPMDGRGSGRAGRVDQSSRRRGSSDGIGVPIGSGAGPDPEGDRGLAGSRSAARLRILLTTLAAPNEGPGGMNRGRRSRGCGGKDCWSRSRIRTPRGVASTPGGLGDGRRRMRVGSVRRTGSTARSVPSRPIRWTGRGGVRSCWPASPRGRHPGRKQGFGPRQGVHSPADRAGMFSIPVSRRSSRRENRDRSFEARRGGSSAPAARSRTCPPCGRRVRNGRWSPPGSPS